MNQLCPTSLIDFTGDGKQLRPGFQIPPFSGRYIDFRWLKFHHLWYHSVFIWN